MSTGEPLTAFFRPSYIPSTIPTVHTRCRGSKEEQAQHPTSTVSSRVWKAGVLGEHTLTVEEAQRQPADGGERRSQRTAARERVSYKEIEEDDEEAFMQEEWYKSTHDISGQCLKEMSLEATMEGGMMTGGTMEGDVMEGAHEPGVLLEDPAQVGSTIAGTHEAEVLVRRKRSRAPRGPAKQAQRRPAKEDHVTSERWPDARAEWAPQGVALVSALKVNRPGRMLKPNPRYADSLEGAGKPRLASRKRRTVSFVEGTAVYDGDSARRLHKYARQLSIQQVQVFQC